MSSILRRNGVFHPASEFAFPRFDTLFDRVFGENGGLEAVTADLTGTGMSVWEDEEHICLEVDAPGVNEEDVDLTLHQGVLTVKFVRKPVEGRTYLYNMRKLGEFKREIRLPDTISPDAVDAKMKNGVLSLTLKKTPEAKPRKISVQRVD
jgi:HSP20 family protein